MSDPTAPPPPPPPPLNLGIEARPRAMNRPFAGFVTVFAWGLREHLRPRKTLFMFGLAVALGLASSLLVTQTRHHGGQDADWRLWQALDQEVLLILVPLTALLLVGPMFSRETRQRTLVYHLVRPVSRTTVFLARYVAGVVPATAVCAVIFCSTIFFSGVDVSGVVWVGVVGTALAGAAVLGAVYYVLSALFRRGLVVGLIYTFVIEVILGNLPGTIQKLSVRFHLRSLHHGLTDDAFAERSKDVARAVQEAAEGSMLRAPLEEPLYAFVSLVCITGVLLALGAYRTARRDFALKD